MKRWLGMMAVTGVILTVAVAVSQPPRGDKDRGPGERRDGPPPPPRFELGRVLPPPLVEDLDLTQEQKAAIDKLEKEVKARLSKILTAEQKKKAENFRPRGPGGPGRHDGPGGPPPRGSDLERKGGADKPPRPESSDKEQAANSAGKIQWYATLEGGLREAQRTNMPILLISAAPHCAGVSGIW